jgi:hypothetical protein
MKGKRKEPEPKCWNVLGARAPASKGAPRIKYAFVMNLMYREMEMRFD